MQDAVGGGKIVLGVVNMKAHALASLLKLFHSHKHSLIKLKNALAVFVKLLLVGVSFHLFALQSIVVDIQRQEKGNFKSSAPVVAVTVARSVVWIPHGTLFYQIVLLGLNVGFFGVGVIYYGARKPYNRSLRNAVFERRVVFYNVLYRHVVTLAERIQRLVLLGCVVHELRILTIGLSGVAFGNLQHRAGLESVLGVGIILKNILLRNAVLLANGIERLFFLNGMIDKLLGIARNLIVAHNRNLDARSLGHLAHESLVFHVNLLNGNVVRLGYSVDGFARLNGVEIVFCSEYLDKYVRFFHLG